MLGRESTRLAWFFTRLGVKEHTKPDLNVRPLVAELFLTENCNLRCISCNCWRQNTKGELATAEWERVLTELSDIKIHKVNFTGGEPLIRPDAIGLMRFATEQGIRHLHLNTNGIRLRPEIAEQILEAGVRSFNISVDGPNGLTHDRIRGRLGSFDTTMRHLNYLLGRRDAYGLKIRMNFTVMRDNVRLLPQMAQLAQELKVRLYLNLATDTTFLFRADQVSDIKSVDAGDIDSALAELEQMLRTDPKWLPRYSDLAYMRRHFSDLVQRDLPCAESQLKLMIHSRGEIGGCWGHDPTFNIRERTIREVIDSEEYQKEHARFFRKECVGCGSNYSLNLRWRPSSYREDALWRLGRRSLEQQ